MNQRSTWSLCEFPRPKTTRPIPIYFKVLQEPSESTMIRSDFLAFPPRARLRRRPERWRCLAGRPTPKIPDGPDLQLPFSTFQIDAGTIGASEVASRPVVPKVHFVPPKSPLSPTAPSFGGSTCHKMLWWSKWPKKNTLGQTNGACHVWQKITLPCPPPPLRGPPWNAWRNSCHSHIWMQVGSNKKKHHAVCPLKTRFTLRAMRQSSTKLKLQILLDASITYCITCISPHPHTRFLWQRQDPCRPAEIIRWIYRWNVVCWF